MARTVLTRLSPRCGRREVYKYRKSHADLERRVSASLSKSNLDKTADFGSVLRFLSTRFDAFKKSGGGLLPQGYLYSTATGDKTTHLLALQVPNRSSADDGTLQGGPTGGPRQGIPRETLWGLRKEPKGRSSVHEFLLR